MCVGTKARWFNLRWRLRPMASNFRNLGKVCAYKLVYRRIENKVRRRLWIFRKKTKKKPHRFIGDVQNEKEVFEESRGWGKTGRSLKDYTSSFTWKWQVNFGSNTKIQGLVIQTFTCYFMQIYPYFPVLLMRHYFQL